MKIFSLLPLTNHNIFLHKHRFESLIEPGIKSFNVQVLQGSTFIIKTGNILTATGTFKKINK